MTSCAGRLPHVHGRSVAILDARRALACRPEHQRRERSLARSQIYWRSGSRPLGRTDVGPLWSNAQSHESLKIGQRDDPSCA